jgi:hypothetical protein
MPEGARYSYECGFYCIMLLSPTTGKAMPGENLKKIFNLSRWTSEIKRYK